MTNPLSSIITGLENWEASALAGAEQLLIGIAAKFTSAQFAAVTAAAQAFKASLAAGNTTSAAWTDAYNVLSAAEGAALNDAELGLADALIEILGNAPTL